MQFFVKSLAVVLFALFALGMQGCFSNRDCLSLAPEIIANESPSASASPATTPVAKDSAALASNSANNTSTELLDINGEPLDLYKSSKTEDPDKPFKTAAAVIGITAVSILGVLMIFSLQAMPGLGD